MQFVPLRPPPLAIFAVATLAPLVLIGLGAAFGGFWVAAAFVYMAGLSALLDQAIPSLVGDAVVGAEFPAADATLAIIGMGHLVALPLVTWAIAGDGAHGAWERGGLFIAAGFWFGQVAHPAAHELIHRSDRALFRLGMVIYTSLLIGHHTSAHRLVHHRHVATAADPNSALLGESCYRFAMRAWVGSFRDGLAAEKALRARNPMPGPVHPYVMYVGGALLCLLAGYLVAGLPGLLVWLGLAMHAQAQLFLADYVQHYGLQRAILPGGKPEPVGPQHAWNAHHWFSSSLMLNAPRHSDHHAHPARAFPALQLPPQNEAPRLPWPLPVACVMALSPRLWRRAIHPHLTQWRAGVGRVR